MTVEEMNRPTSLQYDVTFSGFAIDTLAPVGCHDVDQGDLVLVERDGKTLAECQTCGATWLIGLLVQFRPYGGGAR